MFDGILQLRPYQKEALAKMMEYDGKAALVVMAMGLGKTVVFAEFIRRKVVEDDATCLILSHQEELVNHPLEYLKDLPCGVEQEKRHANPARDKVISASIQSLVNRLPQYNPREIDYIIIDEAHHAAAPTYRKILDYFEGAQIFGFTATPRRGDAVGLNCVFSEIIYDRNIYWAIKNDYLVPIECKQVKLKYRLGDVCVREFDFDQKQLATAMSGTALGIAEAYHRYARGPTVIFAVSVREVHEIVEAINKSCDRPIAAAITARTTNRSALISAFKAGSIKVLVNFGVLTEGVNIPCIETVMMARPIARKNISLYAQCVGRGLRLYPGKKSCLVIDLIGNFSGKICTASTLIGQEATAARIKRKEKESIDPKKDTEGIVLDCSPDTWLEDSKEVDVMHQTPDTDMHGVAWIAEADGGYFLPLPGMLYRISKPCADGRVFLYKNKKHSRVPADLQFVFDYVFLELQQKHPGKEALWNNASRNKWMSDQATDAQCQLIKKFYPDFGDTSNLSKGDASAIIKNFLYLKGGNG